MNKKQGDEIQFSLEKRLSKIKWIHPTHQTSRWIMLKDGVFDSSVLIEIFSFVLKCLSCNRKNNSWGDEIKRTGRENR